MLTTIQQERIRAQLFDLRPEARINRVNDIELMARRAHGDERLRLLALHQFVSAEVASLNKLEPTPAPAASETAKPVATERLTPAEIGLGWGWIAAIVTSVGVVCFTVYQCATHPTPVAQVTAAPTTMPVETGATWWPYVVTCLIVAGLLSAIKPKPATSGETYGEMGGTKHGRDSNSTAQTVVNNIYINTNQASQ